MTPLQLFRDREDAGRRLATRLLSFRAAHPLVLGLPRGGVPVAFEVARALSAPLDVWVVRKIGIPSQPEIAMGAIAEGGEVYLDAGIVAAAGVSEAEVGDILASKSAEVESRRCRFRRGRPAPQVSRRTVIVVDDGAATGATARAALRAIRRGGPGKLVFAVPVGATDTLESLRSEADAVVCLAPDPQLLAVGCWYEDFTQTSDEDVLALLDRAPEEPTPHTPVPRE